jgi:hypothetical protein
LIDSTDIFLIQIKIAHIFFIIDFFAHRYTTRNEF